MCNKKTKKAKMKKKIYYGVSTILLLLLGFFFSYNVYAADLREYPGINKVDWQTKEVDNPIPADYATILRPSSKIVYQPYGNYIANNGYYTFKATDIRNGGENGLWAKNIAIYNGMHIDLRINLVSYEGSRNDDKVDLYASKTKDKFLQVYLQDGNKSKKKLRIDYEFYESGTSKRVDFSGMWNFKRINNVKAMTYDNSPHAMNSIYAYNTSSLLYTQERDGMRVVGSGYDQNDRPDLFSFTTLFNTNNGVYTQYVETVNNKLAEIKYEADPITRMELPNPQIVGEITDYSNIEYTAIQDMPVQLQQDFYPKDYRLKFTFPTVIDLQSVKNKSDITDLDGNNRTDRFTLSKGMGDNSIIASVSPSDLQNPNFVDNSYQFNITGDLVDDGTIGQYYNVSSKRFIIPTTVQSITKYRNRFGILEEKYSKLQTGNAKVNAKIDAIAKRQMVPQGSSTKDWVNKTIKDITTSYSPAFKGDDLKIINIEDKSFPTVGDKESVKVTVRGTKSEIEKTVSIPVTVLAKRKATINYLDPQMKPIKPTETKIGYETLNYDYSSSVQNIENYTFVKSEGDLIQGIYGTKDLVINLIYRENNQDVTIKYQDTKIPGKTIFTAKNESLSVGKSHKLKALEIPGFKMVNVTVDGQSKAVDPDGSFDLLMPNKKIDVIFNYTPAHMKIDLSVDQTQVTQLEKIEVTGKLTSLMKYSKNDTENNYSDDFIIKINTSEATDLGKVSNVKVKTSSGEDVTGMIKNNGNYILVKLNKNIPDTENLVVTFTSNILESAKTGEKIKYNLQVTNSYVLKTNTPKDTYPSDVSANRKTETEIIGSLRLLEAPKAIDFGELKYLAKDQQVNNPIIDGKLEVFDTRVGTKNWTMQAVMETPLKDGTEVLPSEIIYKNKKEEFVLTSAAQSVYVNNIKNDKVSITDSWNVENGIKLKVKSTDKLKKGNYQGKIRWTVITAD